MAPVGSPGDVHHVTIRDELVLAGASWPRGASRRPASNATGERFTRRMSSYRLDDADLMQPLVAARAAERAPTMGICRRWSPADQIADHYTKVSAALVPDWGVTLRLFENAPGCNPLGSSPVDDGGDYDQALRPPWSPRMRTSTAVWRRTRRHAETSGERLRVLDADTAWLDRSRSLARLSWHSWSSRVPPRLA